MHLNKDLLKVMLSLPAPYNMYMTVSYNRLSTVFALDSVTQLLPSR